MFYLVNVKKSHLRVLGALVQIQSGSLLGGQEPCKEKRKSSYISDSIWVMLPDLIANGKQYDRWKKLHDFVPVHLTILYKESVLSHSLNIPMTVDRERS